MSYRFDELFPNLNISANTKRLLEKAKVTKVNTNSSRTSISIYLCFDVIIPRKRIVAIEEEIKEAIYGDFDGNITIIESFQLSDLYTPEVIYNEYLESFCDEMMDMSMALYMVYKKAEISFEDNNMHLILEDNAYVKSYENQILKFLFEILNKRCNQNISFSFEYVEKEKIKVEKEDLYLKNRIEEISNNLVKDTYEEKKKKQPKKKEESQDNTFASVIKSDNPDVCYGKDFSDEAMDIVDIIEDIGEVCIRGQITKFEVKNLRKTDERKIISITITDFTDSMDISMFEKTVNIPEICENIKEGGFYKFKGRTKLDDYGKKKDHPELIIQSISGIKKINDFRPPMRMDVAENKRVELHLHTKMSEFDGVSEVADLIKRAKAWGHKAMAITDHGVVQAFCDADHALDKGDDFKLIYGCEIYLVDDTKQAVTFDKGQTIEDEFVVFDIETTGFNPKKNKIIEIGAVKIKDGEVIDTFSEFVNPLVPIPYRITELTSITDDNVKDAETIDKVLPRFLEFSKDCVLVAHNAEFDCGFIKRNCEVEGFEFDFTYVDTVPVARFFHPRMAKVNLDALAKAENVVLEHHHRAVDDAKCTAEIFEKFLKKFKKQEIFTLKEVNEACKPDEDQIKRMFSHHCIVLAKNDIGRINLYRLVSEAHCNYYSRHPRVPKSLLNEWREGLIIGSACEAGELYDALLSYKDDAEITRLVEFYDYLEVQPVGNNAFMLKKDKGVYADIETLDDIRAINKKIVKLGEEFGKPVVATCDVHFLDPQDELYRRIIMANKGFDDADDQAPLYLHTTDEMLEEFSYLGTEKAYEIVVENTNMIADMCDYIKPVRPDKCPPVIENSDETLRKICYDKAHEMYGPNLPPQVEERLSRELNSIISNGYAVMYIIAQKLVWKSNEDGYLVGSRGSVGSSLAATMAGITEVNPLSPHYLCDECYYVDFDSPEVLEFSGRGGCDMPDRMCPNCGKKLSKHGFDIPFETFLGFKGDKEPDIDLNFSDEYQSKAHKYTEVIFGEGQTYKAGTVSTVADNTAYGYVKKYFEHRNIHKRAAEVERILGGCTGVKSTTGQHPGGIIVLPVGEDIYSFTPIQHPANKDTDIITTHFDYHKIDANLLKLDILGHLDPTMIKSLEELIGINATEIPLDDKEVMRLFQSTEPLGIQPSDIMGTKLGTLGIPEFGTDFAIEMLIDAKPTEFTDLVRIAGLAHGTDVWLGNAKDLIVNGIATISTAICTRDDIMTYLIHMGLDPAESFTIMERVRKGTVAKGKCAEWPEYKEHMLEHGVPEWYVESCEKIKYMFPKAHAVAYVMMAWRVAYCKIHYPLEYYASFFSIRAGAFDYEKMCFGKSKCEVTIKELKAKIDEQKKNNQEPSATDKDLLRDLRLVQEMYARGFEFLPIDLYKSDAKRFKIEDGKLRPPFTTISGLGDTAAETLAIAAAQQEFISKDDIRERGKIGKTTIEKMTDLGIIKDLSESNQISVFDFMG